MPRLSLLFTLLSIPALHAGNWELAWSDEFDGTGMPDPEKWGYESGMVRNHEMQFYQENRFKNARIEKGILIIEAHRERVENPAHAKGDKDWRKSRAHAKYTSASLRTKGLAEWTYGRIEVRAKVPPGNGTWPAIWTLGANTDQVGWPGCGEIDILEYVGNDPKRIHANAHFLKEGQSVSDLKSHSVPDPSGDFHTYAIEWDETRIHYEIDGKRYKSFDVTKADTAEGNPFRKPHFLILNLAMGGSWGGKIDDSIFPCRFLIDYVRVYKNADPEE